MESVELLLDTNILMIWRGDAQLDKEIAAFACGIDTVVYLEFLQGAMKRELAKTDKFLKRFELISFSPTITFSAIRLVRTYAHSDGLRMPDALIAATALENEIPLLTLNTKDFDFIDGISLI
jgi:tRNA(fMet)-specific endonuclease VapC